MKYVSKRGTTINIPDGLDPKQVAAIKADADNGYGTRAQQRANELAKGGAGKGGKKGPGNSLGINKDGTLNPDTAAAAIAAKEKADIEANVKLGTPTSQTDVSGNKRTTVLNPDGTVSVTDEAGTVLTTFKDKAAAAAAGFMDVNELRSKAEEYTYGSLTKYLDRDAARETEAAKQELANRGIPYDPAAAQDPNSKNLYGRTIGGIDQKYKDMKAEAAAKAVVAGTDVANSYSNIQNSGITTLATGAGSFMPSFQDYAGTSTDTSGDALAIAKMSVDQIMTKYGIDKDAAIKKLALAKQNAGSGGSAPKAEPSGFEIRD